MTIRNFILLIVFYVLFSCSNSEETPEADSTKIELKADSFSWPTKYNEKIDRTSNFKWKQINDQLLSKHQATIEISDIDSALQILKQEKIIDDKTGINDSLFPTFCYLSPSAMLENLIQGNRYRWHDSMKVLTNKDKAFILEQDRLRRSNEFRWHDVTSQIETNNRYPQYRISIPVFSCDKKKFIVCVEKYSAANCMQKGISYLFVSYGTKTKHFLFDQVPECPAATKLQR